MKKLISILLTFAMLLALMPLTVFATSTDGLVYELGENGTSFHYIVSDYEGTSTNVIIPSRYRGLPVKEIGDGAFSNCSKLTNIEIPNSVTAIGDSAFSYCSSLTSIEIPNSVTMIGGRAFDNCDNLEYNFYDNAKYLGNEDNPYYVLIEATQKDDIVSCDIHINTKMIAMYAFSDCYKLTNIEIPNSVTTIDHYAFSGCTSLTSVVIPDSVTMIFDYTFSNCDGLKSIEIPNSVTTIYDRAFYDCDGLTGIVIPNSVTTIYDRAFSDCDSLTSVVMPDSVETIGWYVFSYCENLKNVKIPGTVTSVGPNVFDSCTNLTDIYCEAEEKPYNWDPCWIENCNATVHWGYKPVPVKITTQPKNVSVQSGKVARVTVNATGDGLTYQWYFKNKGDSKFSLTNSYKSNTYSLEMNGTRAGRQVYCVITDKYGNEVKTNTVTLGMAVKITKQPTTVSVQSGKQAKVTVTASGEGKTYKWYYKDKGANKFTLTNTFKGDSYYIEMNGTRAGRQVYCVITDKYGHSVKTNTVTLGMAVKITKQPTSVTVANGSTAKVTVSASGEGKTYKWYFKDKGLSKFYLTTSFKGATYSVTMTNARAGRQVYCVITDKYGNSVKTNTVTLNKK